MSFVIDEDLSYFIGVLIGDGHISNSVKSKLNDKSIDYRIVFDLSDDSLIYELKNILDKKIKTKSIPRLSKVGKNRIPRMNIQIRNKKLFLFLTQDLSIPKGAKSGIIRIPTLILNSIDKIKLNFLAGYFDADGGFRGNSLGFTSASKCMIQDVSIMLDYFEINHIVEKWFNTKYNKYYFGLKLKTNQIDNFLNKIPFRNKNKLDRINNKFLRGDAGAVKRDS